MAEYDVYEDDGGDSDILPMVPALQIPAAVGIGVLILLAVVGNTVTIVAYVTDQRLHTVYDTYIFNLAVTDLLIGCVSMPFYAVYTLQDFSWELGAPFCKVWLVIDFTLCLETVLVTLLLSLDRLQLITLGPHYVTRVTMNKAVLAVGLSWLVAFSLYSPFILAWDHVAGYSTVAELDCDVEFAYNFEYTTTTAVLEFVVPVTCLAVLNCRIYYMIHARLKSSIQPISEKITSVHTEHESAAAVSNTKLSSSYRNNNKKSHPKIRFEPDKISSTVPQNPGHSPDGHQQKSHKKLNSRLRRDFRAARFLATLVLVFLVCWAPYTITTIVVSFCSDDCVHESGYEALNWLLWSKSAINPFLYALNSSRYKYNFRKYLLCWKKQVFPINTETTINTAA